MSEAVQIALIATIAPTVLACASVAIAWVNHRQAKANNKVADGKINEVHKLTNSTLSAANKRIEELEKQVASLVAAATKKSRAH